MAAMAVSLFVFFHFYFMNQKMVFELKKNGLLS